MEHHFVFLWDGIASLQCLFQGPERSLCSCEHQEGKDLCLSVSAGGQNPNCSNWKLNRHIWPAHTDADQPLSDEFSLEPLLSPLSISSLTISSLSWQPWLPIFLRPFKKWWKSSKFILVLTNLLTGVTKLKDFSLTGAQFQSQYCMF